MIQLQIHLCLMLEIYDPLSIHNQDKTKVVHSFERIIS